MKSKFTLLLATLFLLNAANAQIRYLKGVLQGAQQVPAVVSPAGGTVIVKYDAATKFLVLYGNYRNLTAVATSSHIHLAAAGVANPTPLFTLTNTGGLIGTLSGTATLDAAQELSLLAGNMYVNVHNANNPGGEIRAQLTQTTVGQTEFMTARIQGAQTTPPNGSLGRGTAYILIDKTTSSLYLTGSYSGLTTPATNAHIHTGAPHVPGGVIVPLIFTPTTTGTLDTTRILSTTDLNSILGGDTYVNVHTTTNPAGEIRGQVSQLGQQWAFGNDLQGSQEVPANPSLAKGTVIARYNALTNYLELVGDYQNLAAPATAAHIHGPAGPGVSAGILFNLTTTGGTTGTLIGGAILTDPQEVDLLAGNMYVNVHNATYPGGEIRAQLLSTAFGNTDYFNVLMEPAQSVPANTVSTGTGSANVLLDRLTNKVYVTAQFSGLTSNITLSHIHGGAAGSNGGVVIPLSISGTTSGTITGTATVRTSFADSMVNGLSYFNIHTVNYGAGEIRGQLGDIILPVKLKLFNGYKELNKVVLVWQSEESAGFSHYEIEQQDINSLQWIVKASVPVSNIGTAAKYSFKDLPLTGSGNYLYYRIKMIDKDGKFRYSGIVRINYLQSKPELMLLSNPVANNELRFLITGLSTDKNAAVSILDFSGKIVAQKIISARADNVMPLNKLSAGMYKLVVRIDDKVLQQTFIK